MIEIAVPEDDSDGCPGRREHATPHAAEHATDTYVALKKLRLKT